MSHVKYWMALDEMPGIGPAHLREIFDILQKHDLSILDLFGLTEDEIKSEFKFNEKIVKSISAAAQSFPRIERDYLSLLDAGIEIVPFYSSLYPNKLIKTLGNVFPPFLYAVGNLGVLGKKGAAIIGNKNISERGETVAYLAAKELSRHGISVVSGLANGCDMIAHRSALENGGITCAIVPCGILNMKLPSSLKDVYQDKKMVIVSSFHPTKEANVFNAFARNKIICALSYAVFMVEAPSSGGIFEAAKSAVNLGVPLFTTEYAEYKESSAGNKIILDAMGGHPVRGRMQNNVLVPNLDRIIALAKFDRDNNA